MYEDLAHLLSELKSNASETHALTASMTHDQLNWQQYPGKSWSILQCLQHVEISHSAYLKAMEPALLAGRAAGYQRKGPLKTTPAGAYFLKQLAPPVAVKIPAPGILLPGVDLSREEVLDNLGEAHRRIENIIHDFAELDLNRIRFRNPFLPVMRVRAGTGLKILCAHEQRHLWQAENVRAALRAVK
jgi:hypothetical protein